MQPGAPQKAHLLGESVLTRADAHTSKQTALSLQRVMAPITALQITLSLTGHGASSVTRALLAARRK